MTVSSASPLVPATGGVSHLRCHSHYSMGRSAGTPAALWNAARSSSGINALGITDYNSLSGILKFSGLAKDIQPLIGLDCGICLAPGEVAAGRVLLLAQDNQGYRNLCSLLLASYRNLPPKSDATSPYLAIPFRTLLEHSEGIILLSGAHETGLFFCVQQSRGDEEAIALAKETLDVFDDRFFIEFCRNAPPELENVAPGISCDARHPSEIFLQHLVRGACGRIIPPVATSDICYPTIEEHLAYKLMQADRSKSNISVSGLAPMKISEGADMEAIGGSPCFAGGLGKFSMDIDSDDRFHVRSAEAFRELFPDIPVAVENTNAVSARCHFHLQKHGPILPPFSQIIDGKPVEVDEVSELRSQARDGLVKRLRGINENRKRYNDLLSDDCTKKRLIHIEDGDGEYDTYSSRLEHELDIIISMGFPGYFLIVSDFIKWAKKHDIPVGPGRGSGAGSLVAYCLFITDVDPIPYNLLFERFLNPERVSMPDFDIDFCTVRRDEVIEYIRQRYGKDHVCQIATFGEVKPKSAIAVIQRILSVNERPFSYSDTMILSKCMSSSPALSDLPLDYYFASNEWLLSRNEEFDGLSEAVRSLVREESLDSRRQIPVRITSEEKKKLGVKEASIGVSRSAILMDYASHVTGFYRTRGVHAAGVVIGGVPLTELFPVILDEKTGDPVSGFEQKDSEASGAVKFDFLGLKNLTIISDAVKFAKEFASFYHDGFFTTGGRGNKLSIDDIPLDDPHVFETITNGDQVRMVGVFQMASASMQKAVELIRPTNLEHLCAINALNRPGPMRYIPSFASRRNGEETVIYPGGRNLTGPILEETYGYMVYQEQVMQVAQHVAGYSLGGADLLRRAMGKKIPAEMVVQRQIFVHGDDTTPGAMKHSGMTEEAANNLFDDINAFANYGFNKSHSMAYALLAYQTMWLKTYYLPCFMAALATYESAPEKNEPIVTETRASGVMFLGPDVNHSHGPFRPEIVTASDGTRSMAVRYGLTGLKGCGSFDPAGNRPQGGYRDIVDFLVRNPRLNKSVFVALVDSGALDGIGFSYEGWSRLPGSEDVIGNGADRVKEIEAELKLLEAALEEHKPVLRKLQSAARKKTATESDRVAKDEATEKRDEIKRRVSDLRKEMKKAEKELDANNEMADALLMSDSLVALIREKKEAYEAVVAGERPFNGCGMVRSIIMALYAGYRSLAQKVVAPLVKEGASISEMDIAVRVALLRNREAFDAYRAAPSSPMEVMASERRVFGYYFNVHPLVVGRDQFEAIGAYPPVSWIRYCRHTGGSYPVIPPFKSLSQGKTPGYALVAGMVSIPPRLFEFPDGEGKKRSISVHVSDHTGAVIQCSYDVTDNEYDDAEISFSDIGNDSWERKKHLGTEIRDRPDYVMATLKKAFSSGTPVVLKGSLYQNARGARCYFSWVTPASGVADRIPGRKLDIVISESEVVAAENLDPSDEDDLASIEKRVMNTLSSIRKSLDEASGTGDFVESAPSVFLSERRGDKMTVCKDVETGGGCRIRFVRKKLDGSESVMQDMGCDGVYFVSDPLRRLIDQKPYVRLVSG